MRELAQLLNENHRYFPEWADRPEIAGPLVEADHNSYLAGGYSEEFGYRVSVDQPPVFAPLEGDPDSNRLRYVQITGLHPGYPECARPDDRDHFRSNGRRVEMEDARTPPAGAMCGRDSAGRLPQSPQSIHVIWVGERARNATYHDGFARRLTSILGKWWAAHRRG